MARTEVQTYILAIGVAFFALSVAILSKEITTWSVLVLISTLSIAGICFHISSMRASQSHTLRTILLTYFLVHIVFNIFGYFVKSKFNARARDPRSAQEEFLKSRIKQDADTVYGKQFKLSNISCMEDLRKLHPLTSYQHYEEFTERMAAGEQNVLLGEELLRFGITSGTTGKGKLIPISKSRLTNTIPINLMLLYDACKKKYGAPSPLQKQIVLYVNPKPTTTPGGDIVGPMHLYTEDMKVFVEMMGNTPWEACTINTEHEAHYITLLFGLRDPHIGVWIGPFSSQIHKAMSKVEKYWKQFVHDIKTGTIDKALQIPSEVRQACEKKLSPNSDRAEELRKEFEKGFDGIMRRIWPHIKYILGINTADFTSKLEEKYAKGIPIVAGTYISTEGDFGVNLWAGDHDKFALLSNSSVFEFIPEQYINDPEPKTLFIDEVKVGETYEMLASTGCGFYRYRFGDVIKVVDFYCKLPVVKFMYRSGQLLNLRAEKVTEISVDEAVHLMVKDMKGTQLVHWTSAENTLLSQIENVHSQVKYEDGEQFYLIFVEVEKEENCNMELNDNHRQKLDDALQDRNNYYKGYRNAGTICQPKVYLVKPGSFKALREYIIANSTASFNQYKMPRKLKTTGTLKLMLENVITF